MYQILHSHDVDGGAPADHCQGDATYYHGRPFEDDRVWRIHQRAGCSLDVDAMNRAGAYLVGTHDFTSFRGKGCERLSPVVTLESVRVSQEQYRGRGVPAVPVTVWGGKAAPLRSPDTLSLVTVVLTGRSFLYRQVRNIVAFLVEVGQRRLMPADAREILEGRDRRRAPGMAPARGLFLVDVEHGDFRF